MILEAQRALDAARLPSSTVYRRPAPMVASPGYCASELGITFFSPTLYFSLSPVFFTVSYYQLLAGNGVEKLHSLAEWCLIVEGSDLGQQLQEQPVKPFLKGLAREGS